MSSLSKLSWFALQVRARKETATALALRGKGYEVFVPTYIARRRWSDRIAKVECPLFETYLFARFDINDRLPILKVPGVRIVGFGTVPPSIPDEEISALRALVDCKVAVTPHPYFRTGQKITIDYGALRGVQGTIVRQKNEHLLVVSVTLLQRSVAVSIDATSVSAFGIQPQGALRQI